MPSDQQAQSETKGDTVSYSVEISRIESNAYDKIVDIESWMGYHFLLFGASCGATSASMIQKDEINTYKAHRNSCHFQCFADIKTLKGMLLEMFCLDLVGADISRHMARLITASGLTGSHTTPSRTQSLPRERSRSLSIVIFI